MRSKKTKHKKEQIPENLFESDETFAFIAGYTAGGFLYGITWEEMNEIEKKESETFAHLKRYFIDRFWKFMRPVYSENGCQNGRKII